MPFLMIRNDITKVAADAIVNLANRNLLQGSGTSRAIYQAAGEQELTAACEAIGHCDLGRAVCTPAFGLPAKYIFHAVCPAWHGGFFGEAKQLAGAYHSALELAAEYHCESVAFPLLSSGNYGGMFRRWLHAENPQPYGSFGNGSAMRVAAAGWLFDTLDKTLEMAKVTAEVTHNHPEGIKGAQATAAVIFLARTGHSKPEIKQYVEQTFGYDLNRTCDEIRPTYHHVETCQETVPEAIIAFLESVSFEDALRNAVSLGGDSDTLACITGGIAEAFYGMPQELRDETLKRLPEDIREGYELFRWNIGQR